MTTSSPICWSPKAFSTVEEVAFVPVEDIVGIEGFDEEVSEELRERARAYLAQQEKELTQRRKDLNVSDDLAEVKGVTPALLVVLGENGIKTRDDLADLATDELLEFAPAGSLTESKANEIIMAARAHWFEEEDAKKAEEAEDTEEMAEDAEDAEADTSGAEAVETAEESSDGGEKTETG